MNDQHLNEQQAHLPTASTQHPQPEEVRLQSPPPQSRHISIQPLCSPIHRTSPRGTSRPCPPSFTSLDYFDPIGVHQLERRISQISLDESIHSPDIEAHSRSQSGSHSSVPQKPGEGQFDFERTLRRYLELQDEQDIKKRELGVCFENLCVEGLGASASFQQTLGSMFNPLNIIHAFQTLRHPPIRPIISGFEGVVRPGEMLLVLGRPGSGCSTLLKILANERGSFHSVSGSVYYDSLTPNQVATRYRGDVQYCPEDDVHFPTLTVEQTVSFAAKTRAPKRRLQGQSRRSFTDIVTDVYITIFGLGHVRKTPVGDASIRGVSGGEKKRVSISEALATRSRINSWDNSTRGLDSSTALEYVRALRIATDLARTTTIVSIYQASESLFSLFDKVCLIYEGRLVYFGAASQAREYFEEMGWEPKNRQTTPDFLVAVTDPNGRSLKKGLDKEKATRVPKDAEGFERAYRESEIRQANLRDIEEYKRDFTQKDEKVAKYKASSNDERAKGASNKSPYTISLPMQVRAVMLRRVQILKGNFTAQALSTITFVLQAIIIGTTFLKLPQTTSAYFSRGGVIFFALFLPALFSMSEIPALFAQRPIVLRQKNAAMYHPFVEALAMTLVDVPMTFVTIVLYTVILYFIVGLQLSAGQFFIFFLFIFTVTIAMKAFFRGLAAAFKQEAPAQAIAGIMLLGLSLYTGYQIPKPSMIGALRWISYINPIRYGFESLMVNEFHTLNGLCTTLVPRGPGYEGVSLSNQVCTTVGSEPGQDTVSGSRFLELSYGYKLKNMWMNYGILIAFGVGFISLLLLFTEFNTSLANSTSVTLFKRGSKSVVVEEAAIGKESGDEEKQSDTSADTIGNRKSQADSSTVVRSSASTKRAETVGSGGNTDESDTSSSSPSSGAVKEKGRAEHVEAGNEKQADADAAIDTLKNQGKMESIFTWQNIRYLIDAPGGEKKVLLDDVSGLVAPGKLTALMGESGAGKTTLLNVLAERVSTGVVTGDRFVDGRALPSDFQAQTGYCQQTDTHVGTNTVREAFRFSARLRQPRTVSVAEKDAYADKCLMMCGMEEFGEAIVGSLGVEQRKRTTIGVELAAKPKLLLFLDEPTSGLDSQSAWAIMSFLRTLADSGQAILCTIHQPSAELFQVFDRLLLLQKGGKTVYYGDLGHNATTLIKYFEDGGSRECQNGENPAEFMLDVIGAGATAVTDRDWHAVWVNSSNCHALQDELETVYADGRNRPPVAATLHSRYASSWFTQTKELAIRQAQRYWRDPTYVMSKLSLNAIGGLFIGFTFFKAKDSIQGTQNKLFAVFMGTILSAPLGGQIHVPYIKMRNIYEIRERSSRMYHWSALVTAQIFIEMPWNIVGSTLFFLTWYWTVGFENSRAGYTYLMFGLLFPMYYTTIALAVASMCPTAEIAGLLFSFLFSFVLTFDGVLQPYELLGWWKWMYRLSPFTYLIEGIMGQVIGHQQINCSEKEFVTLTPPSGSTCGSFLQTFIQNFGGYLEDPNASDSCRFCSSRTTDEFLQPSFNIFYKHHWRDLGFMCAYIVFNTAAVYLLTYLCRVRTGNPVTYIVSKVKSRKQK